MFLCQAQEHAPIHVCMHVSIALTFYDCKKLALVMDLQRNTLSPLTDAKRSMIAHVYIYFAFNFFPHVQRYLGKCVVPSCFDQSLRIYTKITSAYLYIYKSDENTRLSKYESVFTSANEPNSRQQYNQTKRLSLCICYPAINNSRVQILASRIFCCCHVCR